jgi:hypothetical protein
MRQFDPVVKVIDGTTFYIRPFAAFVAANLSGEMAGVIAPLLSGLSPLIGSENESMMDVDIDKALPGIAEGFSSFSGDKLELIMKKLLTRYKNITAELDGDAQILTEDVVNEIFCGNVQDMFILAAEVIRVNFKGFFEKFGGLSGRVTAMFGTATKSKNTGGLT